MKKYYLIPQWPESAKSFYKKAIVIEMDNGDKILQSYETEVCKIDSNGEFVRLWDGYSVTTTRHINSFLRHEGVIGGGKSWWMAQPVQA